MIFFAEETIRKRMELGEALDAWNEVLVENDFKAMNVWDLSEESSEAVLVYKEAIDLAERGDVEGAQAKLTEFVRCQHNLKLRGEILTALEQSIMDKMKENR